MHHLGQTSLRVKLSTGLARLIQKQRSTAALAIRRGKRDYAFESTDVRTVRLFWILLGTIADKPPRGSGGRAIAAAAAAKRDELLPILRETWPDALVE